MKEWLKMLFHCHKWEIIKERDMIREIHTTRAKQAYTEYHLQCAICGKIKQEEMG